MTPDLDNIIATLGAQHKLDMLVHCRLATLESYGRYCMADEEAMLTAYLCHFPEEVTMETGDGDQEVWCPRQEAELDMRRALRHGLFLRIIALTESSLKRLCDVTQHGACEGLKRSGEGAPKRYRSYLQKIGNINFDAIDAAWEELETLFLIRHCWAHADGDIEPHQLSRIEALRDTIAMIELKADPDVVVIFAEMIHYASDVAVNIIRHIASQIPTPAPPLASSAAL